MQSFPKSIFWLADGNLSSDREVNLQRRVCASDTDQQLSPRTSEAVVDVGYAVGVDFEDSWRVGEDVVDVDGVDEGGGGRDDLLVQRAIERDWDLKIGVSVGLVAACFEASYDAIAGQDLILKDGVVVIDTAKESVRRGVSIDRLDHMDMICRNFLWRSGDIAAVGGAKVADNTGMRLKVADQSLVGYSVLAFVSAEAMNAVDGCAASPMVFQLCKKGIVGRVAEIIEQGVFVIERSDASDGGALMRSAIRNDKANSSSIGGMAQQHLLDKDAAEAMSYKDDFAMIPNLILAEALPESIRQLDARHLAA